MKNAIWDTLAIFPPNPHLLAGPPPIHRACTRGPLRDQMLLLCRLCRVTFPFIILPTPLRLHSSYGSPNIWAVSSAAAPTAEAGGSPRSRWMRRPPVPQSPSNLMITITCSPSAAPHSRWFVSNWPAPFCLIILIATFFTVPSPPTAPELQVLGFINYTFNWFGGVAREFVLGGGLGFCRERQNTSVCLCCLKR